MAFARINCYIPSGAFDLLIVLGSSADFQPAGWGRIFETGNCI